MERFGRLISSSMPNDDNKLIKFATDNIGIKQLFSKLKWEQHQFVTSVFSVLTFTTVTKSMVQPISFDGEFSAGNGIDNTKDSSSYISSSVLSYLLKETGNNWNNQNIVLIIDSCNCVCVPGADKLAVSNVVLKGVQEFLPPSLMTSEDLSHRSIGDLRCCVLTKSDFTIEICYDGIHSCIGRWQMICHTLMLSHCRYWRLENWIV